VHRIVRLNITNRPGAIALAIAAVAIGGVFLVVGLTLLLSLVALGAVVGTGLVLYHKLTGRLPGRAPARAEPDALDPRREVFPAPGPAGRLPERGPSEP
jgi:hypothetical protein